MTYKFNKKAALVIMNRIFFITLVMTGAFILTTLNLQAQSPTPTPTDQTMWGDYKFTSTVELGGRYVSVSGSDNKYRSDFNYRSGLRAYDSSMKWEAEDGKGKAFDSLQLNFSGWGADPSGMARAYMEKAGQYSFDASIRRVNLINRMSNLTLGYNRSNTTRHFGDFNLTIFPDNDKFRIRLGGGLNKQSGDLGFTVRTRDVFPIIGKLNSSTVDLRAGIDTKLLGFNLSFTGGKRTFDDNTKYVIESRNAGFAPTDVNFINQLERKAPNRGGTDYGIFSMHRNFGKRSELSGRFIYSKTDRAFNYNELFSGEGPVSRTDPRLLFIDADLITVDGRVQRNQSRGDVGFTVAVTDNFRLSNTFTFDQFSSYGDSAFLERIISRFQATNIPFARPDSLSLFYVPYHFRRFTNTVEGDYQFSQQFGINVGYRFTRREAEGEENTNNIFLAGTRIRPTKNWSIFADVEKGTADNAFTRLANYDYLNARVRTSYLYKDFNFNLSGIIKNNENPSFTSAVGIVPASELVANIRNRIFSAFVDWNPNADWLISSGYTYTYLSSKTNIVVPLAALTPGFSEFYMRDNYAFIDASAKLHPRVSFFGSYRFDMDKGQNDKVNVDPRFIISSYPFTLHTPEVKLAFKLTKNIDWNIGYQYYSYREKLNVGYFYLNNVNTPTLPSVYTYLPNQNYRAHMPYTSLKITFGGVDR